MVKQQTSYGERVSQLVMWGHWFTGFNIIISLLIGTQYIFDEPWPESFFGQFYLCVTWLGHFSFLCLAVYITTLFPLTFILPYKPILRVLAIIISTVGFGLLILDTKTYPELHLHLKLAFIRSLLEGEQGHIHLKVQQVLVMMPFIAVIQYLFSEWAWNKRRKLTQHRIGWPITFIFFMSFIASHITYIWADIKLYQPIVMQRSNFPLSYPMTARGFMARHGWFDRDDFSQLQAEHRRESFTYPLQPLQSTPVDKKYNLLFIMVDRIRSDMLTQQIMPNFYQFAAKNQVFNDHYTASNNSSALFNILYSLPNNYGTIILNQKLPPLLRDILQSNQYQLSVLSNNELTDKRLLQPLCTDNSPSGCAQTQRTASMSNPQLIDVWRQQLSGQQPWFSVLDLSSPIRLDGPFQIKRNHPEEILKQTYFNTAYQLDKDMAAVFRYVEENLLENTVVVVTAHRGVGYRSIDVVKSYDHAQMRVPFVVHWPGQGHQFYQHKTSHLDIVPTLMMRTMGVTSQPKFYSCGRDLFDKSERPWVLAGSGSEAALITNDQTIVIDITGNYKVYDQNYVRQRHQNVSLSLLMGGLSQLQRFFTTQ